MRNLNAKGKTPVLQVMFKNYLFEEENEKYKRNEHDELTEEPTRAPNIV